MHHPAPLSMLLAALALTASPLAYANELYNKAPGGWSVEAGGEQRFTYDSNPLRQAANVQEIYGSTTSPELVVRKKTTLSEIESRTRVDVNFFNRSAFNSVDLHQKLLLSRSNQRWTALVRGSLDYDTTRTSEVTNYGLNLPKVHSTRVNASPEIQFRADDRNWLSLQGGFIDTTYDNNAYTDYRIYAVNPMYFHRLDPENTLFLSLRAQRYESQSGTSQKSDSFGPALGWTTILSPRLSLSVSAGAQTIRKRGSNTAGSDGVNYTFSAETNYKDATDEVNLRATRALEPFGNGTETLLTAFSATAKRAVSQRISVNAEALYQIADYNDDPGTNLDHGYTLGAGVAYKLTDTLDVETGYRYRNEKLTNVSGQIDQHVVRIGAVIHPNW